MWNPYLDFEIFRPLNIFVNHFFLPAFGHVTRLLWLAPSLKHRIMQQGTSEGQNCSWGVCFPARIAGCSSTLWPPLSSLPHAAGRLAFQLQVTYGTLEPENRCSLAWGYVLEVADCLVPWLGNVGQGRLSERQFSRMIWRI